MCSSKIDYNYTDKSRGTEKSMGIRIISTNKWDFTFQSADNVIEFIQTIPQKTNDLWISGGQQYPCIAICINGKYAAVNFFQNDAGEMWQADYVKNNYHDDVEAYFNLHYVDVVPSGCSKGTGVHKLLELLSQNITEVYAVGDSYNDLSMIQEATYGYTFCYAHQDIKQATDRHVQYVYEVIEDMLGGKYDDLAR